MIRWIGSFFVFDRSLVGSDAVIATTIVAHLVQAFLFCVTDQADGSVPMHAILMTVHGYRWLAAALVFGVCAAAVVGQWCRDVIWWHRLVLLSPQASLLIIAALGAFVAITQAHYADALPRPLAFILSDQIWWLLSPFPYAMAMLARVAE